MAGRQAVMREVVSSQVGGVGGGGHRTNGCSVRGCSRRGRAEAAGGARERETGGRQSWSGSAIGAGYASGYVTIVDVHAKVDEWRRPFFFQRASNFASALR